MIKNALFSPKEDILHQGINTKKMMEQISSYSVVSFDLFDTLLKRDVSTPKDVFLQMECRLKSQFSDFCELRVQAEKDARTRTAEEEVTLEEIYCCIPNLTSQEKAVLMEEEMRMEKSLITLSDELFSVYQMCVKQGKRVLLITDMYLPAEFLEELLHSLGIVDYERLYVSSDCKKTKRTGALYDFVQKESCIEKDDWIHIGDSVRADVLAPRKMGIHTIAIPVKLKRSDLSLSEVNEGNFSLRTLYSFINNHISSKENEYFRFGFEYFGPILWGFAHWLNDQAERNRDERLFFLSRDGYIMKRAFEICIPNPTVEISYLEVSRRSLRVPLLWKNADFDSLLDMLPPSKRITMEAFFECVGLDIKQYSEVLSECGFSENSVFDRRTISQNENLKTLFQMIKMDMIANSKRDYSLLECYLMQEQLKGRFSVVDIGWAGSMQRYITQTLTQMGIAHDMRGYYIGVADYYTRNTRYQNDMELRGFLFDFQNDNAAIDFRRSFVGLFETFFLEQDGSVLNYEESADGQKARGVRGPYEYIVNGVEEREQRCVKEIQRGALEFCKEIEHFSVVRSEMFAPFELFQGLYQRATEPDKKMIEMFADFRFLDDGAVQKLASPEKLQQYILHPNRLKNDFLASRWKNGFMKRLFILPLPYEKIYQFLRRFI